MSAATVPAPSVSALVNIDPRNLRPVAKGSWALYDLANTIWSYAVFSRAIGLYLVDKLGSGDGNLWLQIAVAVSVSINALVSPFLGALSDRYGRRLPFLFVFTIMACLPAMAIPYVDVPLGIALFCVANFGYQSALIYYDATLKLVSTPANRGWISGVGNAVGYMGTVLIAIILLVTGLNAAQTFVVAPILFLALSAPVFLVLKEDGVRGGTGASMGAAWSQTWRTLRSLRQYPGLGRFLAARFFYTDSLATSITVMTVFAVEAIGFGEAESNLVFLGLTVAAIIGGFMWGRLTDHWGPKRTLFIVLCTWAVALVIGGAFLAKVPFLIAGILIGSGFSGMQVADRVLMYRLSPPERLGEFYGLYGLVGKGSQVIGGLVYGLTLFLLFDSLGTGAYQVGIMTLLVTMLIGLFLVRGVPEKREG
jgi:MFS transporter, UMF1 family